VTIFTVSFFISFFQNFSFLKNITLSENFGFSDKIIIITKTIIGFYSEVLFGFYLYSNLIIIFLFAVNITLSFYYFKTKGSLFIKKSSLSGMFFSIFGLGCASCGTALLSTALSFFGLSGVLGFLPLKGEEFIYLGIIFLLFSIFTLYKKIQSPNLCL
jgi:hypothetical protein